MDRNILKRECIPSMQLIEEELGIFEYKVALFPIEKGVSHVFGNSIRRILLSSISGASIVKVNIRGVLHEYATLDNVKEDVVEIISNLKKIVIKLDKDISSIELMLLINKSGVVTAGDFKSTQGVEIVNTNQVIATLTNKRELSLEVTVVQGRDEGIIAEAPIELKKIGDIFVNVDFNPVKRVTFQVIENDDSETLEIFLKTNGAIEPLKAIKNALEYFCKQMSIFAFLKVPQGKVDDLSINSNNFAPILFKPIEELDLSVRSLNCLKVADIEYVGDLAQYVKEQLIKIPNLGKKSLDEIIKILLNHDLSLGTQIDNFKEKVKSRVKSRK